MKTLKLAVLVCFITAYFFCCKEDQLEQNSTYSEFVEKMNEKGISTGNILVYKNGEIIFQNADGLRKISDKTPLTLQSQFRLASVSKQFTAMAIMKLKEADKIDYDQKVNTILEGFPYDNITIRHLLHHTSGLKDYMALMSENWVADDSTKAYILGNNEIIEIFYKVNPELDFQVGERYAYSNTGYLFLASIVERVSGQHFKEFLKTNITDPIGLDNTFLYQYKINEDQNYPKRVFGYEKALNQEDLEDNDYHYLNGVRGDGGIYSTLEDLYKWNLALANYKIIPKAYLDEAWTSGKLNNGDDTGYGFGFRISSNEDKPKSVSHSGGWVGFGTYLYNEYSTKSGFIVLTNNSGENFGDILSGVNNIHKGENYELPKKELIDEMAKLMLKGNINKGIDHYHAHKIDSTQYEVSEGALNYLGYRFLQSDHIEESLSIFKLNVDEYPNSANTYDSYGDALLAKGDSIKALAQFKKCFKMDSTLTYANDKVLKLEAVLKK